jgi:membrane protease YdiL (CAAX protease family)
MSIVRETRVRPGPEALIVVATVALFVFYYLARADAIASLSAGHGMLTVTGRPLSPALHFVAAAMLLAVAPVLFARLALGLRLEELGLGAGRLRVGLAWLAIGIPAALLAGKIGSANPAMPFVYPLDASVRPEPSAFVPYALLQFLYFGAWEVLFRGVLLFGLKDRIGAGPANALQTALSVLAHFGRSFTETLVAIPAGLAFGGVSLHARSIWYIAIIHWLVGVSLDWFILTR